MNEPLGLLVLWPSPSITKAWEYCLCAEQSLSSAPPFHTFLLCGLTPALNLIPLNPPPLRKTNRLLPKDHLPLDQTLLILQHLLSTCWRIFLPSLPHNHHSPCLVVCLWTLLVALLLPKRNPPNSRLALLPSTMAVELCHGLCPY